MRGFPFLLHFAALAALLSPVRSQAQPAARASAADTARLRQALAEVFRGDFRIVRHELSSGTPERGGTFWLVHARPQRRGNWHLTYRYNYTDRVRPRNPHYPHVQHESYIRVGERGCLRRRQGKDLCLGDTIILPFVLDQHRGHTFSLAFQGTGDGFPPRPPAAAGPRPAADSIPNPAAPQLRYVGSRREEHAIRSGGANYEFHAAFVARAPGRFNLSLGLRAADDSSALSLWTGGGSVPVLVVERGQPVTVLLRDERVTGVDSVRRFSSHGGNQYLTTLLLLQPGDSIDLPFHGYSTRPRYNRAVARPPVTELRHADPAIHRLPFRLSTEERFNAWIVPHLPRERRR